MVTSIYAMAGPGVVRWLEDDRRAYLASQWGRRGRSRHPFGWTARLRRWGRPARPAPALMSRPC